MNWFPLILIPVIVVQVLLEFALKYVFKDARTSRHKRLRIILLCITITVLVASRAVEWANARKQTEKLGEIGTDVRTNRQEVRERFQNLTGVLATNPSLDSVKRLAILDNEGNRVAEAKTNLVKSYELITNDVFSLRTLREGRENKDAERELQNREAKIQHAVEDIKRQEVEKQAAIQRNKQEQKTREENLNREQRVSAQYLEIFNYVVRRLHTMLTALAADAGVKMFSDFPVSDVPFLGELDFVHTNRFVNSTNHIGLGTNSGWRFEISTTTPYPVVPIRYGLRLSSPALRIMSQGANGASTLTVKPIRPDEEVGPESYNQSGSPPVNGEVAGVSVALSITNQPGPSFLCDFMKNIGRLRQPLQRREQLSGDYSKVVDEVMRSFLGEVDRQCPLAKEAKAHGE